MFAIGNTVDSESPARRTRDEIPARLRTATRQLALLLILCGVRPTWI
jgi:hypothetical protein